MRTYRVYFADGNQKLFDADNLCDVAVATRGMGIVTEIREV